MWELSSGGGITQTSQREYQLLPDMLECVGSGLKALGNTKIDSHSLGKAIALRQQVVPILCPCPEHSDQKLVPVRLPVSRVRDEW